MKNMTLSAIANACGGVYRGSEQYQQKLVSMVTTDSRKMEPDCLFFAIAGERVDGHDFIHDMYEKGALCCISEWELSEEVTEGHPYIQVASSLQALKDVAAFYRSGLQAKVVGITGSVGKTSTKETIASVLAQQYNVLKTLGNFNNEIGVPLTIFRMTEETEAAVIEMGISDFGEMTRLAQIVRPDISVITNIGQCHLENLKTRDGILKAKTEMFDYLAEDGSVVLNGDDDKLRTITQVKDRKPYFFGIEQQKTAAVYAKNIVNLGLDGMQCDICVRDTAHGNGAEHASDTAGWSSTDAEVRGNGVTQLQQVHIPIPGHHMVYNALAATMVGRLLGMDSEQIRKGLEQIESLSGRNHILHENTLTIIDDCYNANPVSMKASIDVISTAIGRKVCILGDMFELGEQEKQLHYEVGAYLAEKPVDLLIAVGGLSEQLAQGTKDTNAEQTCTVVHFATRDEMLLQLSQLIHKGDSVLVKASHGMEFPKVVECLTKLQLS